jgi:transcriptional regulator of acetoin/glycerol metabolism
MKIEHIDELVSVAEGSTSERDPVIQDSWRRCLNMHRLDPSVFRQACILPPNELRPCRQAMEEFLHIARFGLEALYHKVAHSGYTLLLTNAQGVTVDFIGDRALDSRLRSARLYLGADWNEEHSGTCAVGTCIAAGEALTVHQTDHFDATNISLTCTSAPIFNSRGELSAVLDISALQSPSTKDSQYLALELVKTYSHRIENANLMNDFRREWILKLSSSPEFADVCPDYLLALDSAGRIIGFNHRAQKLLAKEVGIDWRNSSLLLGQPVTNLFECDLNILPTFVRSRPAQQRAMLLKHSKLALFAHVMMPPATEPARSSDAGETAIPEPLRSVTGATRLSMTYLSVLPSSWIPE